MRIIPFMTTKLRELGLIVGLSALVVNLVPFVVPYPIYYEALLEYRYPVDFTGNGKCRVENSIAVERGWLFGGKTQRGLHVRGLSENMQVMEKTCKECKFQELQRVYRVDRDRLYLVYPKVVSLHTASNQNL